MIAGLLAVGTVGFALAEDVSPWHAFVLTLDTVATTGSIPSPENTAGEILKVLLTFLGVGTLFYALVTVTELFVAGHLGRALAERRERRMTASLSDHCIICGYGRVGRQVARDLRDARAPYVVIGLDEDDRDHAVGVRFIVGNASEDDVLRDAGIERARAVVACVDSDAENIFICLTARELRNDILIVARASNEDAESKLRRAGADRVISPYRSSGREMARLALHPNIVGALDVTEDHRLQEIQVLSDAERVPEDVMVVGIRRPDGSFTLRPPATERLVPGDVVIAVGTDAALARAADTLAPPAS